MVALRDRSRTWPIYLGVAALAVALGLIWWAVKPFTGEKTVTAGGGAPVTTIALTPGTAAQSTAPAQTSPATAGGTAAPTTAPTAPTASTAPGTTAPAPTGPAGPLQIADVSATCTARGSTDSRGNLVKFSSSNLIDGNNGTAWRCDGNGSGEYLTFVLAAPSQITQVGAIPGYDRIDPYNGDDRFTENRRVTQLHWVCLDPNGTALATFDQDFADSRQMQTAEVPNFARCSSVRAEISGTTQPGRRDYTAISEIALAGRRG
jgi:hypothetical protein